MIKNKFLSFFGLVSIKEYRELEFKNLLLTAGMAILGQLSAEENDAHEAEVKRLQSLAISDKIAGEPKPDVKSEEKPKKKNVSPEQQTK